MMAYNEYKNVTELLYYWHICTSSKDGDLNEGVGETNKEKRERDVSLFDIKLVLPNSHSREYLSFVSREVNNNK